MYRFLFFALAAGLFACNDSGSSTKTTASRERKTSSLPADSVAREATYSFIDGCMENAKLTLGNEKAYSFCKCIYAQLKAENPKADSLEIDKLALDTARLAKMADACRD